LRWVILSGDSVDFSRGSKDAMKCWHGQILWFGLLAAANLLTALPTMAAGGGTSAPVFLDRITVQDDGIYLFAASGSSFLNPDACVSSAVIIVPVGSPTFSVYASTAMTALAARKPLQVWVSGCQVSPWYASVPKAVSIKLYGQ
jgi:hypothetical protein